MRAILAWIFAGTGIFLVASEPGFAADLVLKAPRRPIEPAYSWTGFYVGGNLGYGWSSGRTTSFAPNPIPPGGGLVQIAGAGAPISFNTSGAVGGFQLGYNWQFSRQWVGGLEADFSLTGIKGGGTSNNLSPVFIPFTSTADERLPWFGTVRARLGYLPTNNLLVYGTGGFAYGRMKQDIAYNNNTGAPSNFDGACPTGPATCYAGSSARFATGWTAGGGFEYALMNNWTVRAEYLYVNLAGNTLPESVLGGVFPGFAPSTINAQYDDLALHLVRAGMNYKF